LDRLRVIDVAHNALSGDLPSRWAVDRLERLDVKANAFTGAIPTILARATRLRHLDLSQNALRSRANLAVLTIPTLEHLDVSGNSLDWNEAAAAPAPKIDRARAIEPPSLHDDL
jgi:Leucine-rich repeat (LRR) protein